MAARCLCLFAKKTGAPSYEAAPVKGVMLADSNRHYPSVGIFDGPVPEVIQLLLDREATCTF